MAQQRGVKRAASVLKRKQKKDKLQKATVMHQMEHAGHDHAGHDHEHEHKEEKPTAKKAKPAKEAKEAK